MDRSEEGIAGDSAPGPEPGGEGAARALPARRAQRGALETHRPGSCVQSFALPTLVCSKGHPAFPFLLHILCLSIIKAVPGESLLFSNFIIFLNYSFHFVLEYGQ